MVADLTHIVAHHSQYHYLASIKDGGGMYDFVDQPVGRLGEGSRFVLWAMRRWTSAARHGICRRTAIGGAFVTAGAAAAIADFHAAFARLHRLEGQPIVFAPIGCPVIAESEAIILALWADLVAGNHDRVQAVLRLIAPVGAAERIGESLAGAADHLRHAGLAPSGLARSGKVISKERGETHDE